MRTTQTPPRRAPEALRDLVARLQALHDPAQRPRRAPLPLADRAVSLRFGAVHEWFASADRPPAAIFMHLVCTALAAEAGSVALWVSRRVWPHPQALVEHLDRVIFVDADRDARLWALDLALRKPAVAVVVGDGSGLSMSATRRLQLAAEAGGAMALLWRPIAERTQLSAAATRWLVEPAPSFNQRPRWALTRLRDKTAAISTQPPEPGNSHVLVEWCEQGLVRVPADVADRPGAPGEQPARGAGEYDGVGEAA